MTRYLPSRRYRQAGLTALGFSAVSAWLAIGWPPGFIAATLLALTSALFLLLGFRPAVEIHETHLATGRRIVPWADIRRVDRVYLSPLIVRLTLADRRRILLIYGGNLDSCNSLLRHVRRSSRLALIEGQDYRQFFGDPPPVTPKPQVQPAPRYLMLRPEDEAEVERLYQRLKTVGHLDPRSGDEK